MIQPKQNVYSYNQNGKLLSIELELIIFNQSENTYVIAQPWSMGIEPFPYILKVNGREQATYRFPSCAPQFHENQEVVLLPQSSQKLIYKVSYLKASFIDAKETGSFKIALAYDYILRKNKNELQNIIKTNDKCLKYDLIPLKTDWSNEIEIILTE